ncbi:hypothetical protein I5Q34_14740 [Streptomyces sp. AV19]|uniref:hypothetical protein n=1 Tax=Streptomyces sp. AV19 TaxID=2793068 RepID=UPI0018FE61A7|nr:hypothetical protein [Streptomyces sp. AV19]MBH1935515.1 hypothetical protein [Streptomyces sp. AV19]MDG4534403.1 hypothetical protein [Streptomyces sp. AV19]
MSSCERDREAVRRLLVSCRPAVPPGLAARAAGRGRRLLRARRALRALGWTLLAAAAVAFCVWAALTEPWAVHPADTAPPLEDW